MAETLKKQENKVFVFVSVRKTLSIDIIWNSDINGYILKYKFQIEHNGYIFEMSHIGAGTANSTVETLDKKKNKVFVSAERKKVSPKLCF